MTVHLGGHGAVSAGLVALATGVVLQPAVVALLARRQVLDIPNERSSHTVPTPRGGGIAVVAAIVVGLLVLPQSTWMVLVPLVCYAALGLVDDVRSASAKVRLVVQLGIGLVTGAILVADTPVSATIAIVMTVILAVWTTGYVNAFNFMDGINGISAANAIIGGLAFVAIGVVTDLPLLTGAGAAVGAAALTFLPWNAGRARIFLGDVGSYGLGGALSALAAYAVLHGVPLEAALSPLALYLADTGWTLLRRFVAGERLSQAHRWHIFHQLVDAGFSHAQVAFGTAALTAVLTVCGHVSLIGGGLARSLADLVALVALILYILMLPYVARTRRSRASIGIDDASVADGASVIHVRDIVGPDDVISADGVIISSTGVISGTDVISECYAPEGNSVDRSSAVRSDPRYAQPATFVKSTGPNTGEFRVLR